MMLGMPPDPQSPEPTLASTRPWLARLLPTDHPAAGPLLTSRALRAFGDGFMALLLPAYLLELGLGTLEVGVISTATMLGSALTTLAVGAWGHHFASQTLLRAAAWLMVATGLAFAGAPSFWPLLVVAFVGTLNPSSGDVSVFLPLEHARLADSAQGEARVALFARYSVLGALCAALGALAAGLPDALHRHAGVTRIDALRGMFVVYAVLGLVVGWWWAGCTGACRQRRRRRARAGARATPPPRWGPRVASWPSSRRSSAWMPSPAA